MKKYANYSFRFFLGVIVTMSVIALNTLNVSAPIQLMASFVLLSVGHKLSNYIKE